MSPYRLKFKITNKKKLGFILPIVLVLVCFIWRHQSNLLEFQDQVSDPPLQKLNNQDAEHRHQQEFCDFPKLDPWDKSIVEFIRRDKLQCKKSQLMEQITKYTNINS